SAGTGGWHAGEPPDRRAQAVAARHGVDISSLRARQGRRDARRRSAHITALDRENLAGLGAIRPEDASAQLSLLLDHVAGREGEAVADPFFGGGAGGGGGRRSLLWRRGAVRGDLARCQRGRPGAGAEDRRRIVSAFSRRVAEV